MSRHRPSGSRGHWWKRLGPDRYQIGWIVDVYYENSRLRWPRGNGRDTDLAGAKRFARRWGLIVPEGWVVVDEDDKEMPGSWETEEEARELGLLGRYLLTGADVKGPRARS